MKKILITLWVLLLPLFAYSEVVEIDNVYYNLSYNSASVTNVSNHYYIGNVVIPESITYNGKSYSVTSIGDNAFYYCGSLTSISIPNSVTSIGKSAFVYCGSLSSISIPNSVTSIGESAFYGCGLSSLVIPNSITSIGSSVFMGCRGLISITIPNSVTSIGERAFSDCNSLTSIKIPDSVLNIGKEAFRDCGNLNSVSLGSNIETIGSRAFSNTSLTTITIPRSVKSIAGGAFSVKSVVISDLSSWCKYEFAAGFTEAYHLYMNEQEIIDLIIPADVNSIPTSAFQKCLSITSVTIPSGVKSIGYVAFENCESLTTISIPESVTSIGLGAFRNCKSLTSVDIPNSITTIESGVFQGCSSLTVVNLGSNVASILSSAFSYCSSIESITIPNNVTTIGAGAFFECTALSSINLTNVTTIAQNAFSACRKLSNVNIGSKVESIGFNAFHNCSGITDFYCTAKQPPITGPDPFLESSVGTATLHVPGSVLDLYTSTPPWNTFGDVVAISGYKVIYFVNGVEYKVEDYAVGETILVEPSPSKEGYTFSGWSEIPETMPEHDVIVTGTFTINKYHLTYIIDGEKYRSYEVEYGEIIAPEEEPTKEDYTFSGWSEIPETMPAHDVIVTGAFTLTYPNGQCETPTISYANGKLRYECKTKGVEFETTISDDDIKTHIGDEVTLTATYTINVIAKAKGYKDSDVASATLCWIDAEPMQEGTKEAEDGVTEVKAIPVLIQAEGNTISVQGAADGSEVSVYNTDGMKLSSTIANKGITTLNAQLISGTTAIVKIGEKAVKVLVK